MRTILALLLLAGAAYGAEPEFTVTNKTGPSFVVQNKTSPKPKAAKSCPCNLCDCADGKCSCRGYCSCKDCPVNPPGYAAIYARVLKGERVTFEVRQRIGSWDKGTWECWLEKGEPVCRLRTVVPTVVPSTPAYPAYPFGYGATCPGGICLPGGR